MKKIAFVFFLSFVVCGIASTGPMKHTVGGYTATITEELLDKVISLSNANDIEALQKLFDSGAAIVLKKGIKVEVVETKLLSGKVKIRPVGMNIELWTVIEAIK